MLSKKMTFSLMSLIIITALAFVAPSAMAQVKVTVSGLTSVQRADAGDTTIEMVVETDKNATLDLTMFAVKVFDKNSLDITPETAPTVVQATQTDDKTDTGMKKYLMTSISDTLYTDDVNLPLRVVVTIPAIGPSDPSDTTAVSAVAYRAITITEITSTEGHPKVVSIQRLRPGSQTVVSAFQEAILQPVPFDVRIVFTEVWTGDLAVPADRLAVTNGVPSNIVIGTPFTRLGNEIDGDPDETELDSTYRPHPNEGRYDNEVESALPGIDEVNVPLTTAADGKYHEYRVTITPHTLPKDFEIKISVKGFDDGGSPLRQFYVPVDVANKPNGREELRLKVKGAARNLTAGYKVTIDAGWIIPATGYLVIAQNKIGSEIDTSGQDADRTNDTPQAINRTPAQLLYNVYPTADLPNLATAFRNGVVVDIESQHPGLVVSEVMWGEDTSLNPSSNSQYIELYNPGAQYKTIADAPHTPDINEALTLIFYAPNEFDAVPAVDAAGDLATGLTDRIGTLDADGDYWSPVGKGQSGRSGTLDDTIDGELTAGRGPFVDAVPIVSMYRAMDADGAVEDGQEAASWTTSAGPKSANFNPLAIGIRHGTPGAATDATTTPADTAAEAKAAADKAAAAVKKTESTGTIPEDGSIYISEIMFAGGGVYCHSGLRSPMVRSSEEINLSGWTITVDNAAADADVSPSVLQRSSRSPTKR